MRTSTPSIGRAAAALATVALAGLITVTPAHAETNLLDDGVITPAELKVWENANPSTPDGSGTSTGSRLVPIDDNAIEYLQVALGALGGVAVVGGLVAAGTARRHGGDAHPA